MATIMENNSAFTTSVLFNLCDLGNFSRFNAIIREVHMTSEKYICVRYLNSVDIIDMTKPKQRNKIPITVDSAIMNPETPILAFKMAANIDGITYDQLQIYDVEAKTTLKSYTIAEKVEYWKWITPKLLALVTLKAIYHWSIEGSTRPVKLTDMTDKVYTGLNEVIMDYVHDPSKKWLAFIGSYMDPKLNWSQDHLFVQPYQGEDQWLSFPAHVAAFTNFNVGENCTPSTLLCLARGIEYNKLELSVSDALDANPGESGLGKKQSTISSDSLVYPLALQISQEYGLIYVITQQGQLFIHDLETAEAICSYSISDHEIRCTIEGPTSGSFYSINKEDQVLLTNVEDSTILSFVSNKLQSTREKLYDLTKLHREMSNENEEFKKWKVAIQNESDKIIRDLEESHSKVIESEKQLSSMSHEIHNYQVSEKQMLNEIEQLKKKKAEQQINEGEDLFTKLEKSLREEIRKLRQETEDQLASLRIQMPNEIKELKKQIVEMQNERDQPHVETNVKREIEQLTSKMVELKNYQISQDEMLKRLSMQNTELNTTLINKNTELIKEKDKIIQILSKSLHIEQDATREKQLEIDNYKKSQEEMMNKMEDFRLLKESNTIEVNFTEYNHAELRRVTNDFNDAFMIGEGGYGPVYKAFIGIKPVAIKILKQESSHGNKQFTQEVKILSRVRHPNLVMLFGACQEAQALIYELLPNGSLYDILRNEQTRDALTSRIRICIASNICSALIVLHSARPHGIVHGDLKSANILLDSNYVAKLSDFGISRYLEKTDLRNTAHHYTSSIKGTPAYWDPELFNAGEMTVQCDVYAFGIILLELVTGRDSRGLRDQVVEGLKMGGKLVDASAGKWPLDEAKKMLQLGLRCSEFSRKNRPNLEMEVWPEIESMLRASLRF